jgi:hypothetical protein
MFGAVLRQTYLLIGNRVGRLAHELLHLVDAAHLAVDLGQYARALLEAEDDVLLDLRKLDVGRQLLELRQLGVGLAEQ